MQKNFLFFIFMLCCNSIFAQTYTVAGNVFNDVDGATIDNSAATFSIPPEFLRVVLIETTGDTIAQAAVVSSIDGSFAFLGVNPGNYYALLLTPNESIAVGDDAPYPILESGWTRTGESLLASGIPDTLVDGRTYSFDVLSNVFGIRFGVQERPYSYNKMNNLLDNTTLSPVPLSVNLSSAFTQGGTDIMEGYDYGSGSIGNYTINLLPKYGTLYLSSTPVTSLADVDSLLPAQFSTLAYLPNSTALTQEQDLFTYYVSDKFTDALPSNVLTKSNDATFVIPFSLLESDEDTYADRNDLDDDNDGITDVQECELNNLAVLTTAFGNGEFSFIRPSMFGYSIAHRTGLDTTADLSHLFGYPPNFGAVVVTISNANTHPTANEFYVNDSTGATQWTVSGTVSSYTVLEHGQQYFSYDTRMITLLNGTSTAIPMAMGQTDSLELNWTSGSDSYNYWVKNDNPRSYPDPSEGLLVLALPTPEPKYFQFSSTANNRQEWATYFVRILPECDYDMDGVPNRLDLDSDNDGCLDALEGSGTFEYADIDTSGGTVRVGTGSSAANQNLCADVSCVDANGIPLIATTSGQAPLETYNELEIADACSIILPVSLVDFQVIKLENNALLRWFTVSEQNNKGFEIEHSTDGNSWTKTGFVKSQSENGNSNTKFNYNFTDNAPVAGRNMYRLKQLDFDGKYEYSPVRTLWFGKEKNISIYPNPAIDNVKISGLKGDENIKLYDITGRIIHHQKSTNTNVDISLSKLVEGVYYIQVIGTDGNMAAYKLVKAK